MLDRSVAQRFERAAIDPCWIECTRRLAELFYEQNLVYRLTREGLTLPVYSSHDHATLEECSGPLSLKLEGVERLSPELYAQCGSLAQDLDHTGPTTCHLFIASELSPSFGLHSDPDDVVLCVVEGEKYLQVEQTTHALSAGEWLFIPRHTPHRAINLRGSRMLSFGLERFLVDKL